MAAVALLRGPFRRVAHRRGAEIGPRAFYIHPVPREIKSDGRRSRANLEVLWDAWKRLARKIGNFQARLLLALLYAIVVLPFGLIVRIFSDSLKINHHRSKEIGWIWRVT